MKTFITILVLAVASFAQINNGGSGGGASGPVQTGILSAGLLAEYRFLDGSGSTLTDSSSNANNGTLCAAGAAPSWTINTGPSTQNSVANVGGLNFTAASTQCVTLPAALNSARTIFLVTRFDTGPGSVWAAPLVGATGTTEWGIVYTSVLGGVSCTGAATPPFSSGTGQFVVGTWKSSVGCQQPTIHSPTGTQLFAFQLGSGGDSTVDQTWVNNNLSPYSPVILPCRANSCGNNTSAAYNTGAYQFGGSATSLAIGSSTWFSGNIYYAAFYSTYLTKAQIAQNYQVIEAQLQQRGLIFTNENTAPITSSSLAANNQLIHVGDSQTFGSGGTTAYSSYTFPSSPAGTWTYVNLGLPAIQSSDVAYNESIPNTISSWQLSAASTNIFFYWLGTNDCVPGSNVNPSAGIANGIRRLRAHLIEDTTFKIIIASMLSRTALDTCKNTINTYMRQNWALYADGFADFGEDVNLGADGANASATWFQGDHVHPTDAANADVLGVIAQRAVNRLYGNRSFSTANTYTTAAPAATAITAATEASFTATITSTLNPGIGACVVITGVTPAGYNSPAGECWQVVTSAAGNFTYQNTVSGLGAGSVFGVASKPLQVDADVYAILGGSAAGNPSFTLESCNGYTGQNIYLKNTNTTSAWVLTPFGSETIDGAATLTMPTASSGNNPVVVLQSTLVSPAAGGCNWKRVQ